jgi:hypothetical protein
MIVWLYAVGLWYMLCCDAGAAKHVMLGCDTVGFNGVLLWGCDDDAVGR